MAYLDNTNPAQPKSVEEYELLLAKAAKTRLKLLSPDEAAIIIECSPAQASSMMMEVNRIQGKDAARYAELIK